MAGASSAPRLADTTDAVEVARLLHDFNVEFGDPTPGAEVLAARLRDLLAGEQTLAILAGRPSVGVALVTLRPNVWYQGRVALLDELYVVPELRGQGVGSGMMELLLATARRRDLARIEIGVDEGDADARRFYERHGYSGIEPGAAGLALLYARELTA